MQACPLLGARAQLLTCQGHDNALKPKGMGGGLIADYQGHSMSGLTSLVQKSGLAATVFGAFVLVAGTPSLVAAQEVWPGYFVDNIETKAVAGTGVEAQDIAFRNAQLAGLREVSGRMVCADSQGLLRIPSDTDLAAMVQSTELTDQKIIGNSYSGLLNIAFDPAKVRAYFAAQQAPFAADPAPRMLVLPILRIDDGPALLFEDNPWMPIWSDGPDRTLLQTFDIPQGDEEDRATFDAELPSRSAAEFLIAKYGFTSGLVAAAQVLSSPEGAPAEITIQSVRIGEGFGSAQIDVSLLAEEEETLDALLYRGARAVQEQASAAFCEGNKTAVEAVFAINVVVIGTDISGWVQIEELLRAHTSIKTLSIIGQREGALDVSVEFVGSLLDLQQVFRSVRFRFEAYTTQQVQSDAIQVFFFAQPDFQPLPQNVRILPLADIKLAN